MGSHICLGSQASREQSGLLCSKAKQPVSPAVPSASVKYGSWGDSVAALFFLILPHSPPLNSPLEVRPPFACEFSLLGISELNSLLAADPLLDLPLVHLYQDKFWLKKIIPRAP